MTWRDAERRWHDTDVAYCDVCGNLIIRRYWEFTTPDGSVLRACREEDEELHARLRRFAPRIEAARATWGSEP